MFVTEDRPVTDDWEHDTPIWDDDPQSGSVAAAHFTPDNISGALQILADMEPGPFLAFALAGIDVDDLPDEDRVTLLRIHQRLISHYTAHLYRDMAAIANSIGDLDLDPQWVPEAASAEIGTANGPAKPARTHPGSSSPQRPQSPPIR